MAYLRAYGWIDFEISRIQYVAIMDFLLGVEVPTNDLKCYSTTTQKQRCGIHRWGLMSAECHCPQVFQRSRTASWVVLDRTPKKQILLVLVLIIVSFLLFLNRFPYTTIKGISCTSSPKVPPRFSVPAAGRKSWPGAWAFQTLY